MIRSYNRSASHHAALDNGLSPVRRRKDAKNNMTFGRANMRYNVSREDPTPSQIQECCQKGFWPLPKTREEMAIRTEKTRLPCERCRPILVVELEMSATASINFYVGTRLIGDPHTKQDVLMM